VKLDKLSAAVGAATLAGTSIAYRFMPDTIPLHWNAAGEIDSWGPRSSILWLGALPLGIALLMSLVPLIDPLRASYERHAKTYRVLERIIVLGLAALVGVSIAAGLGAEIDIGVWVRVLVGLLLVGLGNFMGRLKRNFFVGIKTPWALADDEVWRLTHRRGGYVFVAMGAIYLASLALPPGPTLGIVVSAASLAGIAYLFLYSYLCWRRLRAERGAEEDGRS
jgi:uncharacterized membrane protein